MDYIAIINQIIVLFLVLLIGFIIQKLNIIDHHTSKKLSGFIIYVTSPFLIISAMMDKPDLGWTEIGTIFLISVIVYLFLFGLAMVIPKLLKVPKEDLSVYRFMIIFGNVGFMGFPIIQSIFGKEAVFYASIFNLPFFILIYTLGVYLLSSDKHKDSHFTYKKMFLSPGVIAVAIGITLFSLSLPLPKAVVGTINMIGDLTTPLSMLVIGASLADVNIKGLFLNIRLYIYSVLKLILIPIVVWLALRNFAFNDLLIGVPVIISGMPVAANAVILSKEFGGNTKLASEGIFISTLLTLLSLPILVFFFLN